MKIYREKRGLVKIRQKYRTLYVNTQPCFSDVCSATIHIMHCCVSMAIISVFILLTATYVRQQYQCKVLFPLHGNNIYTNASPCYVLRTLFLFACKDKCLVTLHF